jgi:hypothetical protein
MKRYISIDEVIGTAATYLEEISDEVATYMRQWVWLAMREIGPNYGDLVVEKVILVDGSARKPEYLTGNVLELAVYNEDNHQIPTRFNYQGSRINMKENHRHKVDVYEDRDYIHVSDHESNPSYITIKYWKLPLDDCGLPLIPEDHLLAIVMFLLYSFQLRKSTDFGMMGMYERRWLQLRDKVKASNKSVSGLRAEQMVKEWMSLIPNSKKRF